MPPGESFRVYFENGPRFTETDRPGKVQDNGHSTQYFTFHRLKEGESDWYGWEVQTTGGVEPAQLEGSSTYLERNVVLGGVVKALQFFNFSLLVRREMTVTAPDGDTLVVPVGMPKARGSVGLVLAVEGPWGKEQAKGVNYQSK